MTTLDTLSKVVRTHAPRGTFLTVSSGPGLGRATVSLVLPLLASLFTFTADRRRLLALDLESHRAAGVLLVVEFRTRFRLFGWLSRSFPVAFPIELPRERRALRRAA